MKQQCGMEGKRDPRFRRLSAIGAGLNFIALIFALTAVTSYRWAMVSGPIRGYLGPFVVCQDIPGGVDRCEKGGLGPYRQSFTSYVAGAGAILCVFGLAIGVILGPLVVAMHHAKHHICLKFRHAIFGRFVVTSAAAFSSFVSWICFLLEAKIFVRMQLDESADLGWSFYLELLACLLSIVVGIAASYEWRWSRNVGGDPTVYSRDPEGEKAETIINPNFREAPRTGPTHNNNKGGAQSHSGMNGRSGGLSHHRNQNGIAMTVTSGLPYSITANGTRPPQKLRPINGHAGNGNQRPLSVYDPRRVPTRSSLRRPKPTVPSEPIGEDGIDRSVAEIVSNPAFVNSSPTLRPKKVRYKIESTAV